MEDNLLPGYRYGLELVVSTASVADFIKYKLADDSAWTFKMSTVRSTGEELDRTFMNMPFSPTLTGDYTPWKIFQSELNFVPYIEFADPRPYRLTSRITWITITKL